MSNATSLEQSLGWRDYYELTKPRVVMLMILTSVIGMMLAVPGMVPLDILVLGNLGIALCAGSAATVNHLVDRHIDQRMARTFNRPVAKGRLAPLQALTFALLLGLAGMIILLVFVNALTAWLTLASLLGYAVIYTLFLKRATPQNIVIGGLAGAAPPLLGWTAVTGSMDANGILLALIIFAWTPPHFWALAVHRKEEYANADIPMLPVTHGERYTKIHILLYTIILCLVTLLPYLTGMMGWLYLLGAICLGAGFIYWAVRMLTSEDPKFGMDTFKYSIVYLMALFVIMLLDHYWVTPTHTLL
ncbi:heme o synthase [Simiduia agarivorans]|uniref:Protoheme IX farnesyltransferase n=1 Tax=Simiduia agarivorans (strain DSM 21679 / JCM 13881 / BCRC 17597 / SA1) TaxID=1117647 RepID=K4KN20_SIMAS|nr:heme o synthase [Simiduia agarivorans]AFU99615.1 protoheme IX farnesyltransferase [Simiduia agarivorans SA1 = DSM 21679]